MGRSAGLVTIVISLVCSALLFATQMSGHGGSPSGKDGHDPNVERAQAAAATTEQALAERELDAWAATHGSYAGATVTDIPGARVIRSGATGYCLQIVTTGVAFYDAGPRGSLSPNPC